MRRIDGKRGAVLPLVLGILLSVTLLLTSLLQVPWGIRAVTKRFLLERQRVYDAESALVAYQTGLPHGYFERPPWNVKLPGVDRDRLGPWVDLSASTGALAGANAGTFTDSEKRVHVLAGIACDSGCRALRSRSLRREIYEGFRSQLNRDIMVVKPPLRLQTKSGNRRLFGRIRPTALRVVDGDLSLDLEGGIASGRFMVDGAVELRGSAVFDTLRVYARGPLTIRGRTKVRWLEAFSEDRVEISGDVEFSGVVAARCEVAFPDGMRKVRLRYPSFVLSLESSETVAADSMLLPGFVDGILRPFEWRME